MFVRKFIAFIFVWFVATTTTIMAQLIARDAPRQVWSATVPETGLGNAVMITPNEELVIITSRNGVVTALDINTGVQQWRWSPPPVVNQPIYSNSSVTFTQSTLFGEFLVTAISSGLPGLGPFQCQIFALTFTGTELWGTTSNIEGECSGTPVVSSDGEYVFFTHNGNENGLDSGAFTILVTELNGTVLRNQAVDHPLSPIGIFHSPSEGRYDGGEGNTHDMLVWAFTPILGETEVGTRTETFGFQFPLGFEDYLTWQGDPYPVRRLYDAPWYSTAAPVLSNEGKNLYFSVSNSAFANWVASDDAGKFDTAPTRDTAYPEGSPAFLAPFSSVALSSDTTAPMLFAGTAGNLFIKMNPDGSPDWQVSTGSLVKAKAVVTPDDSLVCYIEEGGTLHVASVTSGTDLLTAEYNDAVFANFAMSSNGQILYVATEGGAVLAWEVAIPVGPTPSPTVSGPPTRTKSPLPDIPNGPQPGDFVSCNVCGGNLVMTELDAFAVIPEVGNVTCYTVDCLGKDGLIPSDFCGTIAAFVTACACFDPSSPPSLPPTPQPTIAPTPLPTPGLAALTPTPLPTNVPTTAASGAPTPYYFASAISTLIVLILSLNCC